MLHLEGKFLVLETNRNKKTRVNFGSSQYLFISFIYPFLFFFEVQTNKFNIKETINQIRNKKQNSFHFQEHTEYSISLCDRKVILFSFSSSIRSSYIYEHNRVQEILLLTNLETKGVILQQQKEEKRKREKADFFFLMNDLFT